MDISEGSDDSDNALCHDSMERRRRAKRRRVLVALRAQQAARARCLSAGGRMPNFHRDRDHVLRKVSAMSDRLFVRHFRLCREDFYAVLDLVRSHLLLVVCNVDSL